MKKVILRFASCLPIVVFLLCAQNANASITEIKDNINSPTTWTKENSPYVITRNIIVNAPLTIKPGVVVKLYQTKNGSTIITLGGFTIKADLIAIGSESEKISFTSLLDDSIGGDTNGDGNATMPNKSNWGGIYINDTSATVTLEHVVVSYGSYAIIYNSVYDQNHYIGLTMRNSEIKNNVVGFNLRSVLPVIERNIISGNNTGVATFTDYGDRIIEISSNAIFDNQYGIDGRNPFGSTCTKIKAPYNWWGDASGPQIKPSGYDAVGYKSENPGGMGQLIRGSCFQFEPWLHEESEIYDNVCRKNCFSNVLFLPGLEASRLYGDVDSTCAFDGNSMKKTWEPNCSEDVRWLYLNADGKSLNSIHTEAGDIVDETPVGSNIYKSFIEKMNEMKNQDKAINDWKPIAYDWRLSLDDILSDGSVEATLRALADSSKSKKVTIVAHSNGGLLAKALMQKLGDVEAKKLIDKIIFVAVPQVGTPAAIAGLLHGEDQNFFPVLDTKTARGFGENMPGAYNLLPSEKYFSTVETPVADFKTQQSLDWKDIFNAPIDSKNELHKFLVDDFRRVSATDSDVNSPIKLNEGLLNNAENLHDELDSWMAPDGVKIVQIAGWGVPDTLSSTEYGTQDKKTCDESICQSGVDYLNPDFKFTIDGDGTVVTPSALWMGGAERYWLDLDSYNIFLIRHADHSNILEIPQLNSFIADNITNKTKSISYYDYLSANVPASSDQTRLQYSLHSPLSFELYDDDGNHTGKDSNGKIEEQIPGTYFKQFGDTKYIFADEGVASHIKMKGYENGKFTFAVEEFKGNESLGKITFKDMPVTPKTKVTFDVSEDLQSASNLEIDEDGDGTVDFELKPKIGEIVVFDTIPPTTIDSVEGTPGTNDWRTSDVTLSLSANDNENGSGVAETKYSLDNGKTWDTYSNSIALTQEGIFDVQYFSIDNAGNEENVKTATIKIDKTAPEAKIVFNAATQKLDVIGMDNLAGNVDVTISEQANVDDSHPNDRKNAPWPWGWFKKENKKKIIDTATLIDQAGHKTEIVWEKKSSKDRRIDLAISSISYDGAKKDVTNSNLQYKWMQNWRRNEYLLFATHLSIDSMSLESHYFPNKNQTWIMKKPIELADDDNNDDAENRPVWEKMTGMIIPSIITEKGNVKISY